MQNRRTSSSYARAIPIALALTPLACSDAAIAPQNPGSGGGVPQLSCSITDEEVVSGGPGKDGIPALSDPRTATAGEPGTEYLDPDDRVIGIKLGDLVLAIPLNIMWWHEIVNLEVGDRKVSVTHCPLTGSSMAFDRSGIDGAELGVSGLLLRNNLIMYDRNTEESLWPQMTRQARCGARNGTVLDMVPTIEMTWDGWLTLHPNTEVVSSLTGFGRNYRLYPYDDYDKLSNNQLLFPINRFDSRRPAKERVLGIADPNGARAYPFGELLELGFTAVVDTETDAIFWDSLRQAAMAYKKVLDGQTLDFYFEAGQIRDEQTESVWRIDGLAVSGPLAGKRLEPVAEAYVAYWFAWAAFHTDTELWLTP